MDTSTALIIYRRHLERYIVFNADEWEVFAGHLTFSKLKKKQHFAMADAVCDKIGFIVSGDVYLDCDLPHLKMIKTIS